MWDVVIDDMNESMRWVCYVVMFLIWMIWMNQTPSFSSYHLTCDSYHPGPSHIKSKWLWLIGISESEYRNIISYIIISNHIIVISISLIISSIIIISYRIIKSEIKSNEKDDKTDWPNKIKSTFGGRIESWTVQLQLLIRVHLIQGVHQWAKDFFIDENQSVFGLTCSVWSSRFHRFKFIYFHFP